MDVGEISSPLRDQGDNLILGAAVASSSSQRITTYWN